MTCSSLNYMSLWQYSHPIISLITLSCSFQKSPFNEYDDLQLEPDLGHNDETLNETNETADVPMDGPSIYKMLQVNCLITYECHHLY